MFIENVHRGSLSEAGLMAERLREPKEPKGAFFGQVKN